jgi:tripartite-type tricarboxylate transporter receptor subunit TctC
MAVNRALTKQKVRDALANLGYEPAGGTPQALASLIESQVDYWTTVVREAGIKLPH